MQSTESSGLQTHSHNSPHSVVGSSSVGRGESSATANSKAETDAAAMQQEIAMLKTQLEHSQRMATLGELTSTTTHEFNNLLMTILNYAKLGLRHDDAATRTKSLHRIHDAANKAGKITGSVLAMARSRSDSRDPVDLKTLAEDSLLLIEREYRKYRIQLEVALEEVPATLGIRNELQRVLLNLLVNARQATQEGGFVRVCLQHDSNNCENVISIRDNGKGMDQETLRKVFDPFFTTKSGPDATGKGGTGIGLSSCKQIIDKHQGRIRVESSLGKGTAFIIRLPVK